MLKKKSADKYSARFICNRTRIVMYKKRLVEKPFSCWDEKTERKSRFLNQVSFLIFLGQQLSINHFRIVVRQEEKKTQAKAQFIVFTPEDPQLLG